LAGALYDYSLAAVTAWFKVTMAVFASTGLTLMMEVKMAIHVDFACVEMLAVLRRPDGG
jgi:hypothetical protein